MGLEYLLEIDLAGPTGGLNVDNGRRRLCTVHGDCACSRGNIWECPCPGKVDSSYILYEYKLQSIYVLYEYTLYIQDSI